jgi:hypothetical protein
MSSGTKPGQELYARWHRADFPFDDPFELLALLRFPDVVDVLAEDLEVLLLEVDLGENRRASLLQLAELRLEVAHAAAHPAQLFRDSLGLDPLAPEERGGTELFELFQGATGLVQQLMLCSLRGQALDFAVDDVQIGGQALHSFANLLDLDA